MRESRKKGEIELAKEMKKDIEIAQEAKMLPILEIAKRVGLSEDALDCYGKYKAKISLNVLEQYANQKDGKLILVSAINPTAAGEGKSTVTVGLGQALNQIGKNAVIALREPSLGPTLGVKGGACGGGYSQVVPMEDINLHFTGDIHAITTANNALSALIDNHIHQGNELCIDPNQIIWKRCLDMNDRALRSVVVGLGGAVNGVTREDAFQITVASEIMAIFCLASDLQDLKARLKRIVIAYNYDGDPVTAGDLGAEGALTLLLKEALAPNLVQTLENTPAIVHGGPFANIAHGCNSLIATRMALKLGDYVVTEAGFGCDLGAEKFFDIKSRIGHLNPEVLVIVATIRALKMHGGMQKDELTTPSVEALKNGLENLQKHVESAQSYGIPFVIAVNKFTTDTDEEIALLKNWAKDNGYPFSLCNVWEKGGEGGKDLAQKVVEVIAKDRNQFHPIYALDLPIEEKVRTIARVVYGADDVEFLPKARKQMIKFAEFGWDQLPICIAKTQYSISDNAKLLGRPTGFTVTIREFSPSIGAGFLVAYAGSIMTMPGLSKKPSALLMDVDENNCAIGLF